METAARGATTSPTRMSAVLSMSPVYRLGRIGPLMVPDRRGGCDGCGQSMPRITQVVFPGGSRVGYICRWRGVDGWIDRERRTPVSPSTRSDDGEQPMTGLVTV